MVYEGNTDLPRPVLENGHEALPTDVLRLRLAEAFFDVTPFYYLVCLSELKSFTRVAATLGVGQPAVSRSIQGLERRLRILLLHRHGRGVEFTPDGLKVLAHSRHLIDHLTCVQNDITTYSEAVAGHVIVALPPSCDSKVSRGLLVELSQRYPAIRLTLREGYTSDCIEWLASATVDIAIATNVPRLPTLHIQDILKDELHLVGKPASFSEFTDVIDARNLGSLKLILPPKPHRLRGEIENLAAAAGVTLCVESEVSGLATTIGLVRSGICFTILPRSIIHSLVQEGFLESRLVIEPMINPVISLVTAMHKQLNPASRAVLGVLEKVVLAARVEQEGENQS